MKGTFSNRVRDAIAFAREEALYHGQDYIGTEHLLLGILRVEDGIAIEILRHLGCDPEKLYEAVVHTLSRTPSSPLGILPLTRTTDKVLKISFREARRFSSPVIDTEHLLLSFLRHRKNKAALVLQHHFGLTYKAACAEVRRRLTTHSETR